MKAYVLYGLVVCITSIFTVLVFLDFRKQWKAAEDFRVEEVPLSVRHLFIAPEQLNIKNWQVGDSSVYRLKTNTKSKQIRFQVAARDFWGSNRFWLKTDGLIQFNNMDLELWRFLDETNLRPGSESRAFFFIQNAIPFPFPPLKIPPNPIVLEQLEAEVIVTPMGPLKCKHSFAYIRSPDGELEPLLELWANAAVRPLGLVRARWQDASLDLVQVAPRAVPEIPPVLLDEIGLNTPLDGSCTRCHEENTGGKDLKLESIVSLNGDTLNLTDALFHHRQAEIVTQDNMIHIQLSKKTRSASARFSWNNGHFWVKPNKKGRLGLSLDEIAHQGNIMVQPNTGRLTLDIEE